MTNATLLAFKTTKVDFVNNIKENKKIELGFSYSYNVKYSNKSVIWHFLYIQNHMESYLVLVMALIFVFEKKRINHIVIVNNIHLIIIQLQVF